MISPIKSVWGNASSTRAIEVSVPRPRARPMAATTAFEDTLLMIKPAATSMEPLVTMVGNAWFRVSTIASFMGI